MGIRLLGLLLLAGCATNLPAGQPVGPLCGPPGLPDPASWRMREAEIIVVNTSDHRPQMVVRAQYTVQGYNLTTLWVEGLLGLVDPAPDEKYAAMWVDSQVIGTDGQLLPAPRWQSCEWKEYRLKEQT